MIPMNEARITPYLGKAPVKLRDERFGVLIQIRASDWTVGVQVPDEEAIRWLPLMTIFDMGHGALAELDRAEVLAHWSHDTLWQEPHRTHAVIAALLGWYATALHQWTDHEGYGRWTGPAAAIPDPIHHTPFQPTSDLNDAWFALARLRSVTGGAIADALAPAALPMHAHPTPEAAARAIVAQILAAVERPVHERARTLVRSYLDTLVLIRSSDVRVPRQILTSADLTTDPLNLPSVDRAPGDPDEDDKYHTYLDFN